jgi:hypothetical protein
MYLCTLEALSPQEIESVNCKCANPKFIGREEMYVYLRMFGSFKSAKSGSANRKSAKKIGPKNRNSANCHICGRSANL